MSGVIGLMAIYLIIYLADLNPFTKIALWTRKLTDPLLAPTRAQMRNLRVDAKFAPLIVILISILFCYFTIRLADEIFGAFHLLVSAAQSRSLKTAVGAILYCLLSIFYIMLLARLVLSWVWSPYQNRLMRLLAQTVDPFLDILRRWLGPSLRRYQSYGSPDWSMIVVPMLAMVIITVLQRVVASVFHIAPNLFT